MLIGLPVPKTTIVSFESSSKKPCNSAAKGHWSCYGYDYSFTHNIESNKNKYVARMVSDYVYVFRHNVMPNM